MAKQTGMSEEEATKKTQELNAAWDAFQKSPAWSKLAMALFFNR